MSEYVSKVRSLTNEQLQLRFQSVLQRSSFFAEIDAQIVRELDANTRLGRNPLDQAKHALLKQYNLDTIPSPLEQFLEAMFMAPTSAKPMMIDALREAVDNLENYPDPPTIIQFLLATSKEEARILSRQSSIQQVTDNAEAIRREAIAQVTHNMGYCSESKSSPAQVNNPWK